MLDNCYSKTLIDTHSMKTVDIKEVIFFCLVHKIRLIVKNTDCLFLAGFELMVRLCASLGDINQSIEIISLIFKFLQLNHYTDYLFSTSLLLCHNSICDLHIFCIYIFTLTRKLVRFRTNKLTSFLDKFNLFFFAKCSKIIQLR